MLDFMAYLAEHHHEELVMFFDKKTGLRALIGIHSTTLGPSLGGIRLWHYDNTEAAALDVLRLSKGMTYKAAVAGLPLGGGKTVMMADGQESDPLIRAARFQALGRAIKRLGGRYIGAEDVGTKPTDMMNIHQQTDYVVGLPPNQGGSGDPSPITAFGVFRGIEALAKEVLHRDDLGGLRVAIQGLGKVGMALADHLLEAGAEVTGCDISAEQCQIAQDKGVRVVDLEAIYDVPCEIFSPCALGASLNTETIPRLQCQIVAGAANNQLAEDRHIHDLEARNIVYMVDYVINAGGLINVAAEALRDYRPEQVLAQTSKIYETVQRVYHISQTENITTLEAANRLAEEVLA